ncbi:MAG: LptF/LptG family permease [Elusimicrobiota bacterium]
MKIFTGYILKQFFSHTALSLMLFVFILLMDKIFQIINLLINKGLDIGSALMLVIYSLPTILVLSMPMGILSGAILSFGKMASDGEITVIRTSGSTLKPIVIPVLAATIALAALMIPFNYIVAPNSQFKFREKFLSIAMKDPALRLEESTLIEISPYTLLCLSVDHKKRQLKEIIIYKEADDEGPSVSINARRGKWLTGNDGELVMNLYNGTIRHQPDEHPEKMSNIDFKNYRIIIKSSKNVTGHGKSIETMTASELKDEIKRLRSKGLPAHNIEARYYLRSSLAGAIPVLLLIGIPLGIRAENKGKTIGIGLSLVVIAVYYFLMVAGLKMAFSRIFLPWLGVWLPNIIVGTAGFLMLKKSYGK